LVSNIILSAYTWVVARMEAFKEERGQDILEYAVLAGGIALVLAFVLVANEGLLGYFEDFTTYVGDCITFSPDCGA